MDDNFNNRENREDINTPVCNAEEIHTDDTKRFAMDDDGKMRTGRNGAAAISANSRTFIVLGWISAALTAFISPYFAIAGVVFGILANRQAKGSGTVVIITNIILAAINILFGLFLVEMVRRMMFRI